MYLELKISQVSNPQNRREVKINVVQTKEENKTAEKCGWNHLLCQSPIPVQLFMCENPENKTACPEAICNCISIKAYFLPKAPKALMKRPLPRKTALKIPSHGETTLGYVNAKETALLQNWWKNAKNEFLQNPLEKKEESPSTPQPKPQLESVDRSANLQLVKTPETQISLSRRRGISDFD